MVGRAEGDDFQLDAADAEAIAGREPGVAERLAVRRVSGDQRRMIVASSPRRMRQWSGPTPAARSRNVQRDPPPTLHFPRGCG